MVVKTPSPEAGGQTTEPPAPEELRPKDDAASRASAEAAAAAAASADAPKAGRTAKRKTYRPSHKATFIGLAVVVLILAVNAGVVAVVIKKQSTTDSKVPEAQVTINQGVLDKLGVSRNSIGQSGVELTINPNTRFGGNVQVSSNVSIAGDLKLNSKFSASDASLAQLQAGKTALSELNVNGDATASRLNLRNDLTVTGTARIQGATTFSQLVTVNNNLNVSGSLSIGGVLAVNSFHATNLVADSNIVFGGHFVSQGSAPSVTAGGGIGNNGTVGISGSDAVGTVSVNAGTGATGGILANVTFRNKYTGIPRVVVTTVGANVPSVYIYRSTTGFSIGVNGGFPPGGYAFDYIVMQ